MFVLLSALAAAAQATPAQPAVPENDPIICTKQNIGSEVGTRLQSKKKVCMRKSDRDFIDRQEKDSISHLINDGDGRMRFIPGPPH